jgi:hypothetical protein
MRVSWHRSVRLGRFHGVWLSPGIGSSTSRGTSDPVEQHHAGPLGRPGRPQLAAPLEQWRISGERLTWETAPSPPTPEDRRRIRIDLGKQWVDVGHSADPIVWVPAEVAVAPVERPLGTRRVVVELGDRETRPLGPKVRSPWRPALDDGDRRAADHDFHADLGGDARRNARVDITLNPREIELRQGAP